MDSLRIADRKVLETYKNPISENHPVVFCCPYIAVKSTWPISIQCVLDLH